MMNNCHLNILSWKKNKVINYSVTKQSLMAKEHLHQLQQVNIKNCMSLYSIDNLPLSFITLNSGLLLAIYILKHDHQLINPIRLILDKSSGDI